MIYGFCLGGGLAIALCTDIRLADENAEFAIPAAKLGLGYNARWVRSLLAAVPPAKAKEMLFTGRRFKVAEAQAMGLVNAVVPAAELENKDAGACRGDRRQRSAHRPRRQLAAKRDSSGRVRSGRRCSGALERHARAVGCVRGCHHARLVDRGREPDLAVAGARHRIGGGIDLGSCRRAQRRIENDRAAANGR